MKNLITLLTISLVSVAAVRAADETKSSYPLTTCVVSGQKLGGMGEPYTFEVKGQDVQLCCSGCRSAFDKNSAEYLKKIQDAKPAN